MEQTYVRLVRLREQIEEAQAQLIAPAERNLRLTRRGFDAGEVNVLALVDALNTYIEVNTRYLEQIEETAQAWAEMHFAAGLSLLREDRS